MKFGICPKGGPFGSFRPQTPYVDKTCTWMKPNALTIKAPKCLTNEDLSGPLRDDFRDF